ncbi:MAG: extracellular solute-binding protein [Nitrososphaeria archaeon]|jgi:multiple sugar transport system substrate-binding protein
MSQEPKKMDRRKFVYAGLGAAVIIVAGAAVYLGTRPATTTTIFSTVPTTTTLTKSTTSTTTLTSATTATTTVTAPTTTTATSTYVVQAGLPPTATITSGPYWGVTLVAYMDSGHNYEPFAQNNGYVRDELGIILEPVADVLANHYAACMRDWQAAASGSPPTYDIVVLEPVWNGAFMQGGYLLQLDNYLDSIKDEIGEPYRNDYNHISPNFRKLYDEWGGNVYAYTEDGDTTNLYYRKDVLTDPTNQANFKAKVGYDLPAPPTTWDQFYDVAKFFSGWDWGGVGKPCYGLTGLTGPWDVTDIQATFLGLFGSFSQGKMMFDENMTPQINNDTGVAVLNYMQKLLSDCMMPGYLSLAWDTMFAQFIGGQALMAITYGDIGRLVLNSGTFAGNSKFINEPSLIGYNVWPAPSENAKHFCSVMGGRIIGVSKYTTQPDAAVAAMLKMSDERHAINYVSDVLSGEDPMYDDYFDMTKTKWNINVDQNWLNIVPKCQVVGYPDHVIPGAAEYYNEIAIEATNFITGKMDATTALSTAEKNFNTITAKYGLDSQVAAWKNFLANARSLGYPV